MQDELKRKEDLNTIRSILNHHLMELLPSISKDIREEGYMIKSAQIEHGVLHMEVILEDNVESIDLDISVE